MAKKQISKALDWQKIITFFLHKRPQLPAALATVDEDAAALVLYQLLENIPGFCAVSTPDLATAERIFSSMKLWRNCFGGTLREPLLLPEAARGKIELAGQENARARVLQAIVDGKAGLVIGSAHAFLNPAVAPERLRDEELVLKTGMRISFQSLLQHLVDLDYDDELEVNVPGEFARRGGLIDLFSPDADAPLRVEFWGDTIESLRLFHPETQRSQGEVDSYRIIGRAKARELQAGEESCNAFDYFGHDFQLISFAPERTLSAVEQFSGAMLREKLARVFFERTHARRYTELLEHAREGVEACGCYIPLSNVMELSQEELAHTSLELMRSLLFEQVNRYLDTDYQVVLLSSTEEASKALRAYCKEQNLDDKRLFFDVGRFNTGMLLAEEKLILLSEHEVLTANAFKRKREMAENDTPPEEEMTRSAGQQQQSEYFSLYDIDENDYVVHINYGIGIFRGIQLAKEKNGAVRELMILEYQDGAKLLLPISQSYQLSRYAGARSNIRLNRLDNIKWSNDKLAAQQAIKSYAGEMLRLQVLRNVVPGISFPVDDLALKLFVSRFPFQDTPDQKTATGQIAGDMKKNRPMDRLLCGDVGYGKTEIAMRSAFLAVQAGYQVALLAPTTVLVQQHFESFLERFAEYPFIIDQLSRFRTVQEQNKVLKQLEEGKVDIVVGTSALCNPSIKFKNLGLVIIDEEQRFGVNQKERLRRLRADVDVLSMSATPIPRTLYLAMAGARDLSTLITPPSLRLPVKTLIAPEDDKLVADAIRFEMERKGQIYYLHNRVKTIEDCADKLRLLVPGCRIAVAHGQMEEKDLERVMTAFQHGDVDCLVSSTIIESGLDIQNANTIIIERADRFGLAELYQLRGRVGRWKHQAFAYMLLPKDQIITPDGRKRIQAIRRCSNLGAGFQLAIRDLEIRGSGNLLGHEQSGHLNTIGFDLYCQILKQEVARMSHQEVKILIDPEISIDFLTLGVLPGKDAIAAGFARSFIESDRLRIGAYRKLASIDTLQGLSDFEQELCDRFGKLPDEARHMFRYATVKLLTALGNYRNLSVFDGKVLLKGDRGTFRLDGKIPTINYKNPPSLRLEHLIHILKKAVD